ncbi:unnamed protein product [Auanema sp. JU1783]|nr:unnamed protein product [Auanema sp. JU1783]
MFQAVTSQQIRCYKGLKYVVGQDAYQDTEDCEPILGIGDAYCYRFYEESAINEVMKMGCSNVICNAFRNTCVETELTGIKGRLCCCSDRHYCNGSTSTKRMMLVPFVIPIIIFFVVFLEIMISDL